MSSDANEPSPRNGDAAHVTVAATTTTPSTPTPFVNSSAEGGSGEPRSKRPRIKDKDGSATDHHHHHHTTPPSVSVSVSGNSNNQGGMGTPVLSPSLSATGASTSATPIPTTTLAATGTSVTSTPSLIASHASLISPSFGSITTMDLAAPLSSPFLAPSSSPTLVASYPSRQRLATLNTPLNGMAAMSVGTPISTPLTGGTSMTGSSSTSLTSSSLSSSLSSHLPVLQLPPAHTLINTHTVITTADNAAATSSISDTNDAGNCPFEWFSVHAHLGYTVIEESESDDDDDDDEDSNTIATTSNNDHVAVTAAAPGTVTSYASTSYATYPTTYYTSSGYTYSYPAYTHSYANAEDSSLLQSNDDTSNEYAQHTTILTTTVSDPSLLDRIKMAHQVCQTIAVKGKRCCVQICPICHVIDCFA
jgi:hypothetical protein